MRSGLTCRFAGNARDLFEFLCILLCDGRQRAFRPTILDKGIWEGPDLVSVFFVPAMREFFSVIRDGFFQSDAGNGWKRL